MVAKRMPVIIGRLLHVFLFGTLIGSLAMGQDAVPATGWALLGLLSFGRELTGYELRQWAGNSLRHFYAAPAMSQVYAELDRLEAAGLTASREVAQGRRPVRVHRITPGARRRWRSG